MIVFLLFRYTNSNQSNTKTLKTVLVDPKSLRVNSTLAFKDIITCIYMNMAITSSQMKRSFSVVLQDPTMVHQSWNICTPNATVMNLSRVSKRSDARRHEHDRHPGIPIVRYGTPY